MKTKIASFISIMLLFSFQIASASLVVNGGFEGGTYGTDVGDSFWAEVPVGWTYEHNAGSHNFGVRPYYPLDGHFFSFAQEGGTGTLSQQLATINGQTYTVSFWLRNNPGIAIYPGNDLLSVAWDDSILINLFDSAKFDWTFFTFTMLADSETTNLAFTGGNTGGSYGLDNVSVLEITSVPEPATMLLLGIGLIGLAGYGRKQMASGAVIKL